MKAIQEGINLGTVSHKISMITIFGNKCFNEKISPKKLINFNGFASMLRWFMFGNKLLFFSKITSKTMDKF